MNHKYPMAECGHPSSRSKKECYACARKRYYHSSELIKQKTKEKTGMDCAKWLIEYCITNNLKLPKFYCHSMNPIGKDNITSILTQFSKTQSHK